MKNTKIISIFILTILIMSLLSIPAMATDWSELESDNVLSGTSTEMLPADNQEVLSPTDGTKIVI